MGTSFAAGWRQVAVGFMLLAATGMVATTYSIVAVPLAQEFKPSRTLLMLAMTVLSGVSAVLAPFLGTLMDKVPLRRMMVLGGVSLACGYMAMSWATSFTHVLIVFALLIAPANVLIGPVAVTVLLSRWFAQKRGRAVGIAIAGISAGGFIFPIILQGLFDHFDWREGLRWLGVVLLLWTVPVTLLVVDRPSDKGLYPDGASAPSDLSTVETTSAPVSAASVLRDSTFWILALTVSIVTAGLKGMVTNLVPLAMDAGVIARDAAPLISIYASCAFAAKLAFAALADRLGPRPLMYVSLGGFAVAMGCLTQSSAGFAMIALGVALAGIFGGLMIPAESYLAPRVFGQKAVGRAMGLLSGTILLVMLITPPIYGLIFDVFGSYNGIFWTFGGMAALSMVWLGRLRLTPREDV